jgi:hypothetical protein
MADYKIALELYQSQAGDENAMVKISINDITVGDNVEISNTDSENPTLFVYDVTDLPSPAADATTTVKVELLNDFYVDSANDRDVNWVNCGYAAQDSAGNYRRFIKAPRTPVGPDYDENITEIITDWTDTDNFNWSWGCEYQGDENGTVDMNAGWHTFKISTSYVSATIFLLGSK